MNKKLLIKSIQKLNTYCEKEKFKGYSLYDSHNSPFNFTSLGRKPSFYINQINKRFPINLRPIIKVKKAINPKGYGLFLHAFSLLHNLKIFNKIDVREKSKYFFNWLRKNYSSGYSGYCWGYNYHWPKKDGHDVPAYTPSVVVTGFVARAMLEYYEQFKDKKVKQILRSSANFVLNDIHLYRGEEGYCFSYTPVVEDLTVNANLLAAEVLAYVDYVDKTNRYIDYIERVIDFTFNTQNDDGSWYYKFDYQTRKPKNQIDFHQGYVIESILRLCKYSNLRLTNVRKKQIQKALNYYFTNQFSEDGVALWRYPKRWPVDIHNQSQGIITFSKIREFNNDYLPFASKIATWTIDNMQDKEGFFYYQKWPLITNKVVYMRWNQAWMLLALSTLMQGICNENIY